jgi:dipeptidyl aminopeptidase/acylaminoacyl peptidase
VEVRAEDGTPIRAWLVLPEGEGPHPLVVFAHGGPWGSWNAWTYRWNPGPFAAAGYAVLLPDPAISTGYGQAMIDRGQQQLGGTPFTDIMALTEVAGERADIDSERVALAGGSYGGYMANWVAGHTGSAFKCIVTHASLWNTTSMGRTTDNSSWDQAMREQSAQYSPHLFADDIEVPMLVIHGDKDYRVPIGQGQELWLDLLTQAKTPLDADGDTQHRFLYFPDEGHWILGRGNAEVWYRTVLAFLDTHVLGIDAKVRLWGPRHLPSR